MKLKNKKTGDICEVLTDSIAVKVLIDSHDMTGYYTSLAELNEEWEDYEEPKEYWFVGDHQGPYTSVDNDSQIIRQRKEIGNYFNTREEAEKAVEKLKAWKFLKDIGFKIEGIRYRDHKSYIEWSISQKVRDDHFTSEAFNDALHLVFGGE